MYSPSINNLIKQLKKLPSVGQHTAERFVFYWLRSGKKDVTELMLALKELIENVKSCEVCWNFSDQSPCPTCTDPKRDQSLICVIATPQDLAAIEQIHEYSGRYHVLRGTLDAADEESIRRLKIEELLQRLSPSSTTIKEIILALNPDLPGETTMMYIQKRIKEANSSIKITRLARGLPMGSDVQYADEITLASALKNRV
jgi:recombination protein RecR